MHIRPSFFPRRLLIACAVGASLAAPAAMAANSMSDAQAQYRADVERCNAGDTNQDKATCLREAGAALQEARRNRLLRGSPSYEENQRARCDRLPGAEREDCLIQMTDQSNTVVRGSIAGGGILRETTITIPGEPQPAGTMTTPVAPSSNMAPTTPGTTPAPSLAPTAPGTVPAPSLTPPPSTVPSPAPSTSPSTSPGTGYTPGTGYR